LADPVYLSRKKSHDDDVQSWIVDFLFSGGVFRHPENGYA